MPKITAQLSDAAVRKLKIKGRHPVGGAPGLRLQVTGHGARSWILRVTISQKVRDIGLGNYPTVPLKAAREAAKAAKAEEREAAKPAAKKKKKPAAKKKKKSAKKKSA